MLESGLITRKGFTLPSRQEEEQFFVLHALQLQAVRDQTLARGLGILGGGGGGGKRGQEEGVSP
jgi:hypothetical protein